MWRQTPVAQRDFIIPDYFDQSSKLNLYRENFRIAFAFEGENDYELKDSEEYVKILARFWNQKDANRTETILKHHRCTDEDWKEFYPVAPRS